MARFEALLRSASLPAAVFVITSIGWAAATYKGILPVMQLNALEVFSTLLALVSLGYNYVQHLRDRDRLKPIQNALVSLFNDLRNRQQRCYARQQRLHNADARSPAIWPQLDEFQDFIEETQIGMEQVREHVVGLIRSVAPEFRESDMFRAQDWGMTEDDKKLKAEWNRARLEAMRKGPPEGPAPNQK